MVYSILLDLFKKKNRAETNEEKAHQENKQLAKCIVANIIDHPKTVIGLGSGASIAFIVGKLVREAAKLEKNEIQFVCTEQWMVAALCKHGIRAYKPEHSYKIPSLDFFLESINFICTIQEFKNPLYIKSGRASELRSALMKKAKSVYFVRSGMEVRKDELCGIPVEAQNNSTGFNLYKSLNEKKGGVVGLTSNIHVKSESIFMEWVPPSDWRDNDLFHPNKSGNTLMKEINKLKGVKSHNLFASFKCEFIETVDDLDQMFKKLNNNSERPVFV